MLPSRVAPHYVEKRRQWRRNTNSGRQAGKSENVKGFKNPHKPTQAQFTGQTRPVKAPELERRVNRFLAGEDKGTEKKKKAVHRSCSRSTLPTWATRHRQNHTGFSPVSTTSWLIDPEQVPDMTLIPRFTVEQRKQ